MFWFNIIIPKFIHVLLISNIDKPKYTGLFIFTFVFFVSIANKSSKNHFVVWQLGSDTNWFLLLSAVSNLISLCFLTFSIVLPKTELSINLKKSFSKLFPACMVLYGFNHASWFNWITLCTFLNISLWFNACFRALIWITYSFLSYRLHASLLHLLVFILSDKNDKSLCKLCKYLVYSTSASRKYPLLLS